MVSFYAQLCILAQDLADNNDDDDGGGGGSFLFLTIWESSPMIPITWGSSEESAYFC